MSLMCTSSFDEKNFLANVIALSWCVIIELLVFFKSIKKTIDDLSEKWLCLTIYVVIFNICVELSAICFMNSRKYLILVFSIIFFFSYIFSFACLKFYERITFLTSAIVFWIFEIHDEFLLNESENDFRSKTVFSTSCWMNAFRYSMYESISQWELSVFNLR